MLWYIPAMVVAESCIVTWEQYLYEEAINTDQSVALMMSIATTRSVAHCNTTLLPPISVTL